MGFFACKFPVSSIPGLALVGYLLHSHDGLQVATPTNGAAWSAQMPLPACLMYLGMGNNVSELPLKSQALETILEAHG